MAAYGENGRPLCPNCSLEVGFLKQNYCSGCGKELQAKKPSSLSPQETEQHEEQHQQHEHEQQQSEEHHESQPPAISPTPAPRIMSVSSPTLITGLGTPPPIRARPPTRPRPPLGNSNISSSLPTLPGLGSSPPSSSTSPHPISLSSSSSSISTSPSSSSSPPSVAPVSLISNATFPLHQSGPEDEPHKIRPPIRPPPRTARPPSSLGSRPQTSKAGGDPTTEEISLPLDEYFHNYALSFVRLSVYAPVEDKEKELLFTPYAIVSDVIKQIHCIICSPDTPSVHYGIYDPMKNMWLCLSRTLLSYHLPDGYKVEYKPRPDAQLLFARIKVLENHAVSMLPVDEDTTAWDIGIQLLTKYNGIRLSDSDAIRPPELRFLPHFLQLFLERSGSVPEQLDEDQPVRPKLLTVAPAFLLNFSLPAAHHETLLLLEEEFREEHPSISPTSSTSSFSSSSSSLLSYSSSSSSSSSSSPSSPSSDASLRSRLGKSLSRKESWFSKQKPSKGSSTIGSPKVSRSALPEHRTVPKGGKASSNLPSETLALRVQNIDGFLTSEEGPKTFSFDPNAPIEKCVKKILKMHPASLDWTQFGFFDPSFAPDGRWLSNQQTLSFYGYKANDTVEFKKRYVTYMISLPGNMQVFYQFDCRALASHLREVIEHNFLRTNLLKDADSASAYGLFIPGDAEGELEMRRTLYSHSSLLTQTIEYRKRLQILTIFAAGKEEVFYVDYLKPLSSIQGEIAAKFDLESLDESTCSFQQHGIMGVSVSLTQPLLVQNIRAPATLIMKVNQSASSEPLSLADDPSLLVNIYDEPTSEATIRYERAPSQDVTPVIMASTLNKLVQHLTHENFSDLMFSQAFLLTYRSFTTPLILLQKLIERYNTPPSFSKAQHGVIKARVLNFIRKWVSEYKPDFEGELRSRVIEFIQFQVMGGAEKSEVTKSTCSKILKKLTEDEKTGKARSRLHAKGASRVLRTSVFVDSGKTLGEKTTIFDFPEEEIAAQLTRIDFDIYQGLTASEFLNQSWSKPQTQHLCPTIMEMITRFNAISMWVAYLILEPPGYQLRAKRFEKLIRIADALLRLNNFQTLMAFLGGMNNAAISRLKFTKDVLNKRSLQKLQELEKLMNMESSYARYREALNQAAPPVIPYLGVYLSDLTFVEDGNPDFIDSLINFSKYQLVYATISKIETYKAKPPETVENLVIGKHLLHIPLYTEKQLYEDSLEREPRGATKARP